MQVSNLFFDDVTVKTDNTSEKMNYFQLCVLF